MSINNKIVLGIVSFFSIIGIIMLIGCSVNTESLYLNNISEQVNTYFCGVGQSFKASLNSGKRENPYQYDGIANDCVNFAILTIFLDNDLSIIEADIFVNGVEQKERLEKNIINGSYIVDLEKTIKKEDNIEVKYKNEKIQLLVKDFLISSDEAMQIGIQSFTEELQSLVSKNKLNAEIYLRVLDSNEDNFENFFWYFYIYSQNGTSRSCVITVDEGDVIIKN